MQKLAIIFNEKLLMYFDFIKTAKGLMKNIPLITLLAVSILFLTTMMLVSSINVYLFKDYFGNATALSIFSILQTGAVFLGMTVLTPLVKRFGKKELGSFGMLTAGVAYIAIFHTKYFFDGIFHC